MAQITLKGATINTIGNLPKVGTAAPDFKLVKTDLSEVTLSEFKGKKVILNIFPSLDTGICSLSMKKFNQEASTLSNVAIVCVSKDLPFAQKRYCDAEGISNLITASDFRYNTFGVDYGVLIIDSGFHGVLSRAVVVIDENGTVTYTEQVPEIAQEPNYDAALKAVK
ncbi:MAG: thiol peroxidase [Ignavibacteriaceae bacterium]|nr:thiol peroxidase [Ignavibacteriaceae bacterium]